MAGLLRPDALAGRTVVLAGGTVDAAGGVDTDAGAGALAAVLAALADGGATVRSLAVALADEEAVAMAVAAVGVIDAVVVDAGAPFREAGGGLAGLRHGVDGAWNVVRAVARAAWMAPAEAAGAGAQSAGGHPTRGAALVLAPRPGDGEHARAAAAALENTVRTLSTEWARFGIVTTAILPGDATTDDEIADLVAYLASPAGAYCSGDAVTLGLV